MTFNVKSIKWYRKLIFPILEIKYFNAIQLSLILLLSCFWSSWDICWFLFLLQYCTLWNFLKMRNAVITFWGVKGTTISSFWNSCLESCKGWGLFNHSKRSALFVLLCIVKKNIIWWNSYARLQNNKKVWSVVKQPLLKLIQTPSQIAKNCRIKSKTLQFLLPWLKSVFPRKAVVKMRFMEQ